MSSAETIAERRLLDRLAPPAEAERDPILGLVGTTYALQPDFFDTDFLPALLGLGAWDDRGWTTRIAIERRLGAMDSATILMEPRRYEGRPRSLRVELVTAPGRARQTLHAKVMAVVHGRSVRLVAGSANLTESGYRLNREVATVITASAKGRDQAPLVRSAILGLRERLEDRLTKGAIGILDRAIALLDEWNPGRGDADDAFLWGGGPVPLWQAFLDHWPAREKVQKITVVSPFWSEEDGKGPLHRFLTEMSRRGMLTAGADIRLLTDAEKDTRGAYRPRLPASYATCDLSRYGAEGLVQVVDPAVPPEEVDMREGFLGMRSLHAKVVLLEGPDTSLAYAGSANFTRNGWGLLDDPARANVEAGIVLRRSGRGRAEVRNLVPATVGPAVQLGTGSADRLAGPEPSPPDVPWPDFIEELVLSPLPEGEEEMGLIVRIRSEHIAGQWSVGLQAKGDLPARTLVASTDTPAAPPDSWRVALDRETLNRFLIDQEALVCWWDWPQGCPVPINVALAARASLPISPGSPDLREEYLVAYYQGRIRWEDLFPDPDAPPPGPEGGDGLPPTGSQVDTSKIQSYQIRDFVEALSGICSDLREAVQSEPAMKLALLGPVSPVALARTVMAAVKAGTRTPTAAGFQLVEILACIESARGHVVVPRLEKAWQETLDKAATDVCQFLRRLRDEHGEELRAGGTFDRYEALVRRHCCSKEGRP